MQDALGTSTLECGQIFNLVEEVEEEIVREVVWAAPFTLEDNQLLGWHFLLRNPKKFVSNNIKI